MRAGAKTGMTGTGWIGRVSDALRRYAHHPDPRVAMANTVALLVASNQPFYPLYLYWTVSETIWPSIGTFLSTPLFLMVPALSRRNDRLGRAMLPIAGMANTLLCCKLFGVASGVEIFLIPCAVLALVLFRPAERWIAFGLVGIAAVVYFVLHDRYGAPAHLYSAAEYTAFTSLNVFSASALTALVALMTSNLLAEAEAKSQR